MTRSLVLGGSGFLGRHVVRALERAGETVTCVDRAAIGGEDAPSRFVGCDLGSLDPSGYDALLRNADIVYHLAWTTIPATANADPIADIGDNARVTLAVLEALRRRGEGRVVFASSGGTVYGRLRVVPAAETHPLEPITAYGVSKLACEKYMQVYRHVHGVDARIARIANPYGAGQNPARGQGAVSTFIHHALAGRTIDLWGDGSVVRDFVHVDDVVAALLAITAYDAAGLEDTPIFNVGGGVHHTIGEILGFVRESVPRPLTVTHHPGRAFDVPVSVLDIERAALRLSWRPQIDIRAGIARMVAELRADPERLYS